VIPELPDWHGSAATHRFFVVDVFAARPLEGNQLGVFVDGRPFDDVQMQRLARELNFAETVFLLPPAQGGDVRVRIFTPVSELPFAGHPIVGTASLVGSALGADAVTLETGHGLVPIELERDGGRVVFAWLRQRPPSSEPFDREAELLDALGVDRSLLPVELYRNGPPHVYVRLAGEDAVVALDPDIAALRRLAVAANCFAGAGRSWKTRMFFPAAGVAEDPATGSAAGPLALHLARHGAISFGDEIEIRQGFEIGRPSWIRAVAREDELAVGGRAEIVAEGRYRITG
jgi:trans-2,3-dihydro-3-hydroxyanthranilate isomerase